MGEYRVGYGEPCVGVSEGDEEEGEPPRSIAAVEEIRASLSCGNVIVTSSLDSKLGVCDLGRGGSVSTSISFKSVF